MAIVKPNFCPSNHKGVDLESLQQLTGELRSYIDNVTGYVNDLRQNAQICENEWPKDPNIVKAVNNLNTALTKIETSLNGINVIKAYVDGNIRQLIGLGTNFGCEEK